MRKVSEYEEHAKQCRLMATDMRDAQHKQQLQAMADTWEMLAEERRKQLAKQTAAQSHGYDCGMPVPVKSNEFGSYEG